MQGNPTELKYAGDFARAIQPTDLTAIHIHFQLRKVKTCHWAFRKFLSPNGHEFK